MATTKTSEAKAFSEWRENRSNGQKASGKSSSQSASRARNTSEPSTSFSDWRERRSENVKSGGNLSQDWQVQQSRQSREDEIYNALTAGMQQNQAQTDQSGARTNTQRDQLLADLKSLRESSGFITDELSRASYDQTEQKILADLAAWDTKLGNGPQDYSDRNLGTRIGNTWGASASGALAGIINAAGTALEAENARRDRDYILQNAIQGSDFAAQVGQEGVERFMAQAPQGDDAYRIASQGTINKMYGLADTMQESSSQMLGEAKYGLGKAGQVAVDVGKGIFDVAGDTALSAMLPGLGMARMATSAFGSAAQEARQQGKDIDEQVFQGIKSAGIEVLTEKIGGPFEKAYGGTLLGKATNKAVEKLGKNSAFRKFLLKSGANFLSEGGEEVMSSFLNTFIDRIMERKAGGYYAKLIEAGQIRGQLEDARAKGLPTEQLEQQLRQAELEQKAIENKLKETLSQYDLSEMLYEGLVGGLTGLIGGTGGAINQARFDAAVDRAVAAVDERAARAGSTDSGTFVTQPTTKAQQLVANLLTTNSEDTIDVILSDNKYKAAFEDLTSKPATAKNIEEFLQGHQEAAGASQSVGNEITPPSPVEAPEQAPDALNSNQSENGRAVDANATTNPAVEALLNPVVQEQAQAPTGPTAEEILAEYGMGQAPVQQAPAQDVQGADALREIAGEEAAPTAATQPSAPRAPRSGRDLARWALGLDQQNQQAAREAEGVDVDATDFDDSRAEIDDIINEVRGWNEGLPNSETNGSIVTENENGGQENVRGSDNAAGREGEDSRGSQQDDGSGSDGGALRAELERRTSGFEREEQGRTESKQVKSLQEAHQEAVDLLQKHNVRILEGDSVPDDIKDCVEYIRGVVPDCPVTVVDDARIGPAYATNAEDGSTGGILLNASKLRNAAAKQGVSLNQVAKHEIGHHLLMRAGLTSDDVRAYVLARVGEDSPEAASLLEAIKFFQQSHGHSYNSNLKEHGKQYADQKLWEELYVDLYAGIPRAFQVNGSVDTSFNLLSTAASDFFNNEVLPNLQNGTGKKSGRNDSRNPIARAMGFLYGDTAAEEEEQRRDYRDFHAGQPNFSSGVDAFLNTKDIPPASRPNSSANESSVTESAADEYERRDAERMRGEAAARVNRRAFSDEDAEVENRNRNKGGYYELRITARAQIQDDNRNISRIMDGQDEWADVSARYRADLLNDILKTDRYYTRGNEVVENDERLHRDYSEFDEYDPDVEEITSETDNRSNTKLTTAEQRLLAAHDRNIAMRTELQKEIERARDAGQPTAALESWMERLKAEGRELSAKIAKDGENGSRKGRYDYSAEDDPGFGRRRPALSEQEKKSAGRALSEQRYRQGLKNAEKEGYNPLRHKSLGRPASYDSVPKFCYEIMSDMNELEAFVKGKYEYGRFSAANRFEACRKMFPDANWQLDPETNAITVGKGEKALFNPTANMGNYDSISAYTNLDSSRAQDEADRRTARRNRINALEVQEAKGLFGGGVDISAADFDEDFSILTTAYSDDVAEALNARDQEIDDLERRDRQREEDEYQEKRWGDKHSIDNAKGWEQQERQRAEAEKEQTTGPKYAVREQLGGEAHDAVNRAARRLAKDTSEPIKGDETKRQFNSKTYGNAEGVITTMSDFAEGNASFADLVEEYGKLEGTAFYEKSTHDQLKAVKEMLDAEEKGWQHVAEDGRFVDNTGKTGGQYKAETAKAVAQAIESINHRVKYVGETGLAPRTDLNGEVRAAASGRAKATTKMIEKLTGVQLRPDVMFKKLGGFVKGSKMYQIADEHMQAIRNKQNQKQAALEYFISATKMKGYEDFAKGKTTIKNPIPGHSDSQLSLNTALGLLKTLETNGAIEHIAKNGAQFAASEKELYSGAHNNGFGDKPSYGQTLDLLSEKTKEHLDAAKDGKEIAHARAAAQLELEALRDTLKAEVMKNDVAKAMYNASFGCMRYLGMNMNDASRTMWGVDFATEGRNYYPMEIAGQGKVRELLNDPRGGLKNKSIVQERTGDSGALRIRPFTDVMSHYIEQSTDWSAFSVLSDKLELLSRNNGGRDIGLTATIGREYGKFYADWLDNYVKDLNGTREGGVQFSGLRSNLASAALTLNGGVALKQSPSYFDAAGVIDMGILVKHSPGLFKTARSFDNNPLIQEVEMRTGMLGQRKLGYNAVEVGEATESARGLSSKVNKLLPNWMTNWITKTDVRTTSNLMLACADQVMQESKDGRGPKVEKGSEEYYRAIADKFEQVILQTQPVYTKQARADYMRNPSDVVRTLAMFRTQQTQNFNQLVTAWGEYQNASAKDKAAAGKQLMTVASGQVIASAMFSVLSAVARAGLHKFDDFKDDEGWSEEKIAKRLGLNMLGSVAGTVWGGSELASFAVDALSGGKTSEFQGLDDNVMSMITDAATSAISWTGDKKDLVKIKNLVLNVSQAFGIPARNAYNMLNSVVMFGLDRSRAANGGAVWDTGKSSDFVKMINDYNEQDDKKRAKTTFDVAMRAMAVGDDARYNALMSTLDYENDDVVEAIKTSAKQRFALGEIDMETYRQILTKWGKMTAEDAKAYAEGQEEKRELKELMADDKVAQLDQQISDAKDRADEYDSSRDYAAMDLIIGALLSDVDTDRLVNAKTSKGYRTSYEAMRQTGMSPAEASTTYKAMDGDNNGSLKQDELVEYYLANPGMEYIIKQIWATKGWKTSWETKRDKAK